MRKPTTKSEGAPATPDFADLMGSQGLRAEDLASRAGVSIATVYRAKRGQNVSRLAGTALCLALGIDLPELEAAIQSSARGAA